MNRNQDYEAAFLEDVAEQIAYKPIRPSIVSELKDHIEDRAGEYEAMGLKEEEARRKAVDSMGDAVAIGTELNALRCVRTCRPLVALTLLLMLAGLAAAAFMRWIPMSNGFLYYLPGSAILLLAALKGYPWLVKYQARFLTVSAAACLLGVASVLLWRFSPLHAAPLIPFFLPWHMIQYYGALLMGPFLVTVLYRMRMDTRKTLLVCALFIGGFTAYNTMIGLFSMGMTAMAVFLFSMAGTVFFMIYRGIFPGSRRRLLSLAAAGSILAAGIYAFLPGQSSYFKMFAQPESVVNSAWDDAYNSVLMKELLSRAPLIGGISLTPQELMEYGTGQWYFDTDDVIYRSEISGTDAGEMDKKVQQFREDGILPRYIDYDESNVTLWDILPQHYHNNYLIALSILLFGWLPGFLFLGVIAAFFWYLFSCIRQMHGKLAGAVSFNCGLCLLGQSILYILGNFGFQYQRFTNLPLVSEGKISIMVNMLLLGFILSAYRYDRVIDEYRYKIKQAAL